MNNLKKFGVKILYKITFSAPNEQLIDDNFNPSNIGFEESIILVNAINIDESLIIAENIALTKEEQYENIYGQKVKIAFYGFIDSFRILDNTLINGTEIYSRIYYASEEKVEEIIKEIY